MNSRPNPDHLAKSDKDHRSQFGKQIVRHARRSRLYIGMEAFLTLRGLFFVGRRYTCPCCGWRLRAFTHGGVSFRIRPLGYCPRCHAKARHRRVWLFLEQRTNLFADSLRLLHVSPEYCFSRRLKKVSNLNYVGVDISDCPNIAIKMDLMAAPLLSESFDAIICIHILEHIEDDRRALSELHRVLKPGGWAVISVPVRMDQKTHEDSRIFSEEERERLFGETSHVRIYGHDFVDRLAQCGFQVELDLGKNVDQKTRESYGLRDDENIFYCTKNRSKNPTP